MCKNLTDLSHTVRYFSTIISPCLQFTSTTTTIKNPSTRSWLGQNPSSCVQEPRSVREAPVWRTVGGTAGIRGEWPPVGRTVFVSTLREGFAGSHYLPPPSRYAVAFKPLDMSANKARNRTNIQTHLEMIGQCGGKNAVAAFSNGRNLRPLRFSSI